MNRVIFQEIVNALKIKIRRNKDFIVVLLHGQIMDRFHLYCNTIMIMTTLAECNITSLICLTSLTRGAKLNDKMVFPA